MSKVISYRVRKYSSTEYVVEKYIVNFWNELNYQDQISYLLRKDIPLNEGRIRLQPSAEEPSVIRFRSDIWNIWGFHDHIKGLCRSHGYDAPETRNLEHFNFFLATHYFYFDEVSHTEEISRLNSLTRTYIQHHNAEVYALKIGRAYDELIGESNDREIDNRDPIHTMNRLLHHIGYLDNSEFTEYRYNHAMIDRFWDDIGFTDPAADRDYSGIAEKVQLYLSNATAAYYRVHRQNNPQAIKKARHLLSKDISYIECLNVGQANCSLGFGKTDKNDPLAIFDVGAAGTSHVKTKMRKATEKGIIVISHYDSDHINGWTNLSNAALQRIWVLPEPRPNPTSTEGRLLDAIAKENCIVRWNVDYTQQPFQRSSHVLELGNIAIYQGNCKKIDSDQSTDENARCLICLITGNQSMLLPGDCLYKEFPVSFSVDYMLVPHHSCCYTKDVTNINRQRLREIIVCAGPNLGYHHPDISHINRLRGRQCSVIYLMKHCRYYFDNKTEIQAPPIILTPRFHTVTL